MSIEKCPVPGCDRDLQKGPFIIEETLTDRGKLVRKPFLSVEHSGGEEKHVVVDRIFEAICPEHGHVVVVSEGNHIELNKLGYEAVGYELSEPWQAITYAVRNNGRCAEEWCFQPGVCARCGADVPRRVRCQLCHTPWWCDECIKHHANEHQAPYLALYLAWQTEFMNMLSGEYEELW